MDQEAKLDYLINYLLAEQKEERFEERPLSFEDKYELFRGLCNVREPNDISKEFLQVQDGFLKKYNRFSGTIKLEDIQELEKDIYLWQGDITRLEVDAIVNAANSELLGCREANHHCIDNIIHTKAGVQLRLACHALMRKQGRKEAVGKAKITKGYNLPARYIIHTVGPYIDSRGVTPLKASLLASSYESSLKLADHYKLDSIAFCCISTGVFNFPNEQAAKIAIETVENYKKSTKSNINVIFNVYKNEDYSIYEKALRKGESK